MVFFPQPAANLLPAGKRPPHGHLLIVHARLLLHVLVEALRRQLHLLEERAVEHGRRGGELAARPGQRGLVRVRMDGQARGDLEGAADLPAVPAAGRAGEVLVVLGGELEDLGVLDHEGGLAGHAVALGLYLLELGDVDLEDLAGLSLVERWLLGLNAVSNCLVLSWKGGTQELT